MKEKFLKALQDKDFAELFKKGGVSFLMRVGGQIMGFLLTLIIIEPFLRGVLNFVSIETILAYSL